MALIDQNIYTKNQIQVLVAHKLLNIKITLIDISNISIDIKKMKKSKIFWLNFLIKKLPKS